MFPSLSDDFLGNIFDNEGSKSYPAVAPLKLINHKGIWYLVARDGDKIKTFSFARVERLSQLDTRFTHDPEIDKMLKEEDGIWLGEEKKEIVFKIAREMAGYFKRRKLIANQVIEKELEDGGLIVSSKVGYSNQVMPIVRYWIPHIRIISPEGLATLEKTGLVNIKKTKFSGNFPERLSGKHYKKIVAEIN